MVLFEYCSGGCLETMVTAAAAVGRSIEDEPALAVELIGYMVDVACAMEYLSKLRCVHRDLATRNVLLAGDGSAKLADFGLSRRLSVEEGVYEQVTARPLPVRWMAPEALIGQKGSLVLDVQTDIWSYGVLVWEAMSLGALPYNDVAGLEAPGAVALYVANGGRLGRPAGCSERFHNALLECWAEEPSERPPFESLSRKMAAFRSEWDGQGGVLPGLSEHQQPRISDELRIKQLLSEINPSELVEWSKSTISALVTEALLREAALGPGSFCFRARFLLPPFLSVSLCFFSVDVASTCLIVVGGLIFGLDVGAAAQTLLG